jgi:broad specificity phosphatase PhoE
MSEHKNIASKVNLGSKQFYFIRHGETDLNKNGLLAGSQDISLNDNGRNQVFAALSALQSREIGVIVSSPMQRTRQTADIIKESLNLPIVYHEGLKEANWGILEGSPVTTIKEKLNDWAQGGQIEKSENIKIFKERIVSALDDILTKYDNPLIVSHGAVYGTFMEIIGMGYIQSDNAMPYYFVPNKNSTNSIYSVYPLLPNNQLGTEKSPKKGSNSELEVK